MSGLDRARLGSPDGKTEIEMEMRRMEGQVVVGLDFGSSSIKASAFRRDGSLVRSSRVQTPVVRSEGVVDLPVRAVLDAADRAVVGLGLEAETVAAVGVATMGEVGTVLGADGLADLDFPAWYDARGADVVRRIVDELGGPRTANLTGNHLRTTSSLAKLRWLADRDRLPPGTFLGIGAAWVWRMTGAIVAEHGLLSTTGAYDPVRRRPVDDIWQLGGLAARGVVVPWEAEAGARAATAEAERIGLPWGAPVVLAGHDHLVGALGVGLDDGELLDSVGTSEGLIAWTRTPRTGRGAWAGRAVASGLTIEPRPGAGPDEVALIWEGLRPGLAMAMFESAAGRSYEEPARLSSGENVPMSRDEAAGWEEGLHPGPADDRSWAALLAYYVDAAEHGARVVRGFAGIGGPLVVTGGGTRSTTWMAAKEAAAGVPVWVASGTESAGRGAAAVAGTSVGWWLSPAGMPGAGRARLERITHTSADSRSPMDPGSVGQNDDSD